MPYSFTQIEKEKSQVIFFVFGFLVLMYFVTALGVILILKNFWWMDDMANSFLSGGLSLAFGLNEIILALFCAVIVGGGHWYVTVQDLVPKMLKALGAEHLKAGDSYHQMLQNIIDEVSIATGGEKIQGVVIPVAAMNTFALSDFEGNHIIGVTEGLLAKLNRAQIEAVVGHEAAHIVSGDCLFTTVTTSIFALYESALDGLSRLFSEDRRGFGRGSGNLALFFVYIFIATTHFCSRLMNMFVSRQREFRADAISVRLTRDPISLAGALRKISTHWRGGHISGSRMEAIFIMNPQYHFLDETNSIFGELFSTHPPVDDRVNVLLDMAKMDKKTLDESIKNAPARKREMSPSQIQPAGVSRWMVYNEGDWKGPFGFNELTQLTFLTPETWVRRNQGDVGNAYEDVDIRNFFQGKVTSAQGVICPRCRISLSEVRYEGASLLQCSGCRGILADESNIMRVIIREDIGFSEQIVRCGRMVQNMQTSGVPLHLDLKAANFIDCPYCPDPKPKMLRQFYNLAYPIEVDKCFQCNHTWFDRDELETLQFLIEESASKK